MKKIKMEEKKEEKTLEENLNDKKFVNYNLIKNLEEIKRINYAILEILTEHFKKEPKPDSEGVFKPKN